MELRCEYFKTSGGALPPKNMVCLLKIVVRGAQFVWLVLSFLL